jgi:hypothetical protein
MKVVAKKTVVVSSLSIGSLSDHLIRLDLDKAAALTRDFPVVTSPPQPPHQVSLTWPIPQHHGEFSGAVRLFQAAEAPGLHRRSRQVSIFPVICAFRH